LTRYAEGNGGDGRGTAGFFAIGVPSDLLGAVLVVVQEADVEFYWWFCRRGRSVVVIVSSVVFSVGLVTRIVPFFSEELEFAYRGWEVYDGCSGCISITVSSSLLVSRRLAFIVAIVVHIAFAFATIFGQFHERHPSIDLCCFLPGSVVE